MLSIYRPRRPRASPLWRIVHHAWQAFLAAYGAVLRPLHGPLRPDTVAVVAQFQRCGDLAAGFTHLQCPDCGHESRPKGDSLPQGRNGAKRSGNRLAFTCKTRHFCPSCHQRRVRQTGDWIARSVCFDVPHQPVRLYHVPPPARDLPQAPRPPRLPLPRLHPDPSPACFHPSCLENPALRQSETDLEAR